MVETIKKIENIYYLQIGVQGENIANSIQMDMSTWLAAIPNAHIHVLFKPYNSVLPSPVPSEMDDSILIWQPTYAETAVTGVGYTEVRALDPNTGIVKKSRIIPTSVENSVSGVDSGTPPSSFQGWVNQVLAVKDTVVQSAEVASALMNVLEQVAENTFAVELIHCGTISSLPVTIEDSSIDSSMILIKSYLDTPAAQTSDWTVTTADGSVTISGTISGSTTVKLYLAGNHGGSGSSSSSSPSSPTFDSAVFE